MGCSLNETHKTDTKEHTEERTEQTGNIETHEESEPGTEADIPETNTEENTETLYSEAYVTVLSNPGKLDVYAVVIPAYINNDIPYTKCFRYDDRYVICLTYDRQGVMPEEEYDNIYLYVIDVVEGNVIHEERLDCTALPENVAYTAADGMILSSERRNEEGNFETACAHSVLVASDGVSVQKAEYKQYPTYRTKVVSPDGKHTAYYVRDDIENRGGVVLGYPDGRTERIRENRVFSDAADAGYTGDAALGYVRGYSPVGFLDDRHLVIEITGYESPSWYEIYNVETGETIRGKEKEYSDEYGTVYSPAAVIDGWLYLREWRCYFTYPNEICGVSKINLAGDYVKLGHIYDTADVFSIPREEYWGMDDKGIWQMYDARYNAWSVELLEYFSSMDYRITKKLYSPDFELLLEAEYPFFHGKVREDVYVSGNNCTIITFVNREEP
ncbi:MAG: hypothetical protein E7658_08625 [Ruminococcaceae bacterium]|nr:hypothetical protein [Oscillospiraceae bacterium]